MPEILVTKELFWDNCFQTFRASHRPYERFSFTNIINTLACLIRLPSFYSSFMNLIESAFCKKKMWQVLLAPVFNWSCVWLCVYALSGVWHDGYNRKACTVETQLFEYRFRILDYLDLNFMISVIVISLRVHRSSTSLSFFCACRHSSSVDGSELDCFTCIHVVPLFWRECIIHQQMLNHFDLFHTT